jgi:hypothetical protein
MKKVLVLTAALFLIASVSQASILEAWLTFVTSGDPIAHDGFNYTLPAGATAPTSAMVGQLYTVELWVEVVPDPSIPGEDISWCGLESMSLSIVTNNSHYVTEPNALGNDPLGQGHHVDPTQVDYQIISNKFPITTQAARQDGTFPKFDVPDGDLDSIENSGSTSTSNYTCALNTPVLFSEQNWLLESWANASLHLEIAPSSDHWDIDGNKVLFSQLQTGTMVNGVFVPGTDLFGGPEAPPPTPPDGPEPATLALFGFGVVVALLRRRNKK